MTKKDDAPVTFPEKFAKVIEKLPEFKDTADAASVDDLKKIIINCEGNIYAIDQEKLNDHKLNGAKEIVKELSEPYRDAIKCATAKIKYALFLLESKGLSIDNRE